MPIAIEDPEIQIYQLAKNVLEVLVIPAGVKKIPASDPRLQGRKPLSVASWFNYPDLRDYYGPSNAVHIVQFKELLGVMIQGDLVPCIVMHQGTHQMLNAIFLCGTFLHIEMKWPIKRVASTLTPLVKLAPCQTYKTEGEPVENDPLLTIEDCLFALETFLQLELLNLNAIDCTEYQMLEQPFSGDMNWIVPGKILALAGPTAEIFPISSFIEYAKGHGIDTMVRLNHLHYDKKKLLAQGIEHYDIFMHDGNIPSWTQIEQFWAIAEHCWAKGGAMAVHCRAGLGRTGTMIGTFLIRKFGLQAIQVIAFLRIMRPGSLLGVQARFLECIQYRLRGEDAFLSGDDMDFLEGLKPEPIPNESEDEDEENIDCDG